MMMRRRLISYRVVVFLLSFELLLALNSFGFRWKKGHLVLGHSRDKEWPIAILALASIYVNIWRELLLGVVGTVLS
jgi:hypothetical protein